MNVVRPIALRDWIAWTLIAGGVVCLGGLGVDAARTAVYQRRLWSTLHAAPQSRPSSDVSASPVSIGDPIGWLEIPRIGVSAGVVHGDSDAQLKIAIGHLPDTPLPSSGGNSVLAGHRDTFFRPLRDVRIGDMVRFETVRDVFEYRVRETFVVDPEDVWVLDSTPTAMLTLVTCYPFEYVGEAPRRFVVRADRVGARQRDALNGEHRANETWHRLRFG